MSVATRQRDMDEVVRQMRQLVAIYLDMLEAPPTRVMHDGFGRLAFVQAAGGVDRAAYVDTLVFMSSEPIEVLAHVMRELDLRAGRHEQPRVRA